MGDNRDENLRLPGPGGNPRGNPYKFNSDELRVLKECNKDSFLYRCIPLGTLFGVATYYGVQSGYFKRHASYGATPKVVVAVIIGYFMGKISYQRTCAERLMQLPNSPIGEMLRQRRKGMLTDSMEPGLGPSMSLAPFSNLGPGEKYSDFEPSNSTDIDTSRPDNNGLDDSHRPSVDNPIYEEEMPPIQKSMTTYEELRKKNREEYQQQRTSNYRTPPPPSAPQQTTPQQSPSETPKVSSRTNIYGDIIS